MMHSNNFVFSVKSNGKVLRESGDIVYVPFGSEFSLYLKNLNSRRASVKISIDGNDVLNGSELIVGANQSMELERYLKDLNKGNRFKFIERSAGVEAHRGVQAEDGLIRIEFAYEKVYAPWITSTYNNDYCGSPVYGGGLHYPPGCRSLLGSSTSDNMSFCDTDRGVKTSSGIAKGLAQNAFLNAVGSAGCNASVETYSTPVNDAGITVPGSESNQKFATVAGFATDASTVMVIKLVGELGQNKVQQAITVKTKQRCQTCGHINKMTSKFCTECGTALVVF
jgi:hypothetical protein